MSKSGRMTVSDCKSHHPHTIWDKVWADTYSCACGTPGTHLLYFLVTGYNPRSLWSLHRRLEIDNSKQGTTSYAAKRE